MKIKFQQVLNWGLLGLVSISPFFQSGRSETAPYCSPTTCTVTSNPALSNSPKWNSSAISNLIDGATYKTRVEIKVNKVPPSAGYPEYSAWFKIDQGSPKIVVTVHVDDYAMIFD